MSDIVKFDFHGDELDCVKEGDALWVSVRRMCEPLGIADRPQREKLQNKSWARGTLIVSPDARGHNQRQFFLHVDSVPMWLATIDEGRVAEKVRPKLVKFQLEAAQALRDHFLRPRIPTNFADALQLAADTEREKQAALKQIEADRPKVEYAMAVKHSQDSCLVGDFAKVLFNTGERIGRNRLFKFLRDERIFTGRLPNQEYIERGYFIVVESTYEAKGKIRTARTAKITGKGKVWLEKRFRNSRGYDPVAAD